jgi:hypothetical protein
MDADGETLEESIERLRQIEKSLGVAVQKAAADGYSAELRQLQRDHINAVKVLCNNRIRQKGVLPLVLTEATVVAAWVLG